MVETHSPKLDKLEFIARLLFKLPPKDALPIFRRLSADDVKTILDQLKRETPNVSPSKSDQQTPVEQKTLNGVPQDHAELDLDELVAAEKTSLIGIANLLQLTDVEIKTVLEHCDTSFWAPALKNANKTIQQKIMNCMAPPVVGLLKVEIERLDKVSLREEQLARLGIVQIACRLGNSGQITWDRPVSDAA